ncbi:hypothetical protein HZS_987 [Henneguya salminicola]|nr:hypothetical protein HZS_987 [Henneguya salminicola]
MARDTMCLISLLFERLEYRNNFKNLNDLKLIYKCIKKVRYNQSEELLKLFKQRRDLFTKYNHKISTCSHENDSMVQNIRLKISTYLDNLLISIP